MAISTRELLLVLRVSDRTGGALRRVASDVGGLNARRNLTLGAQQASQLAAVARARALDAREASAAATMNLRNMRLQRDAAAQAISTLKTQEAQDAAVTIQIREQVAEYERLTSAIEAQSGAVKRLATVRKSTAVAAALADQKVLATQQALNNLRWDRLERGARLIEHIGRVLAIGGTIGTLALGASARAAANFQTQLTLAATQARPIGAPATASLQIQQRLQKVVLEQMRQFPAASQDMAQSLYEIFSGTNIQNVNKAANALKVFNQASVAGGADLGTMTQAGISLINNFERGSTTTKNLTRDFDLFFAAVRYGRMNADQFASSFANILPIAKEAGLTFRDVADAMAFLTRQSGARFTSRDATGLARLIDLFSRKEVQQGLTLKGVNVTDATGKLKPLLTIITDIQNRFNLRPGTETNQFFKTISALGGGGGSRGLAGTQQARRVFAYLINDLKQYQQVAGQVNKDNNEFGKSFQALSKAPGVRWQVFTNQLKALAIIIGGDLIPVFVKLGSYVQVAVHWFQNLSPHTQRLIGTFTLMASVGALLGGVVMMIVGGLTSLALTARLALRGFGLLGSETGAINVRMAAFLGVAGLVLALLIKYPSVLHSVISAMGGLKGVIIGIGIAISSLSFLKLTSGLSTTAAEATAAQGALRGVLVSLGRLAAIVLPTILIPIAYHVVSSDINKPTHADPRTLHFHGPLGFLAKIGSSIEYEVNKHIAGMTSAQARTAVINDVSNSFIKFGVDVVKGVNDKIPQTLGKDPRFKINLFGGLTYGAMPKPAHIIDAAKKASDKSAKDVAKVVTVPFMTALRNVARLQDIYYNSRTYANYAKFTNALNALNARSTKLQQGYISDYLSQSGQAEKKAIRERDKITKTQFFEELKNVIRLRNEYLKTNDPKILMQFYDAKTKLMRESNASEKQYLSNSISRTNEAYKQQIARQKAAAKEAARVQNQTYADALSNLTTLYNQFFSEQQTNFGQLFQGPYLSGQRMQTAFSWGYKTRPSDLLKDLKSEVFQYGRFNRLVAQLQSRGAPRELINQVRAAGPAAMQDIYDLTKMTPAQWKAYVAAFERGQNEIKSNTMRQLNSQIALYKQHGKNIAKAIVAGITSEDQRLQHAIDNMLRRALGLKPTANYRPSPHRGGVTNNNETTIHVHGHPADARTRAAIRHGLFRTRVHTAGTF